MKKAKKQSRNGFLDETENIWQVVRYLGGIGLGFTPIAKIKDEIAQKETTNEKEIIIVLLSNFIPLLLSQI